MKSHLTVIYPYYENPLFFARQLGVWCSYPQWMREKLRFIVVDDGSPEHPVADVAPLSVARQCLSLRLFRVGVDVRWNWLAARNIGQHYAEDGWTLMTDMDHVIPEDTMLSVLRDGHNESVIYRFSRREHTGTKIHPHPNSWLMTRKMFWRIGGYDEALSGYYGTDGEYRRRCAATARVEILPLELERHEYVGDSSTARYKRKQPEDARGKEMIRRRGPWWTPRTLSFPHREVTP